MSVPTVVSGVGVAVKVTLRFQFPETADLSVGEMIVTAGPWSMNVLTMRVVEREGVAWSVAVQENFTGPDGIDWS